MPNILKRSIYTVNAFVQKIFLRLTQVQGIPMNTTMSSVLLELSTLKEGMDDKQVDNYIYRYIHMYDLSNILYF